MSEKTKIVRIFSRLNIGGPSIHVVLLSQEVNKNFETILITGQVHPEEGDMSYLLNKKEGYRHIFIPELGRRIHIWNDCIAFLKVLKILFHEKPQILHTHTAKAGFLGRLAALLVGVPVRIHTYHGHLFEGYYGKLGSSLIKWVEKILGLCTTQVIAISPKQKEDLQKFGILKAEKISVIPLGFDLASFERGDLHRDSIKQRLGIPLNKYCIGVIGRLVPIKNHSLFLRIAKCVLDEREDVHFLIVGDGISYETIYEEAKKLGILEHLSFLHWQRDLKPIYSILDIVLLTSLNEGTPVSLIEAEAHGVSVIATKVGGVEDVVLSEKSGYVVPLDDEEGFRDKIFLLLNNPDLRKRMGLCGKQFVFDHFGKKRLIRDMERLYQKLLGQRQR